jgi:hypothetical protein
MFSTVFGYLNSHHIQKKTFRYQYICILHGLGPFIDRLRGLVVRVPGWRSRGPGSILSATRFSEKYESGTGSTQPRWAQLRSYLDGKSSRSGLESREYGSRNPSRWPRDTLCPQKLELTSPTSGGRSVGIVRSRTEATELKLGLFICWEVCRSLISNMAEALCYKPEGRGFETRWGH